MSQVLYFNPTTLHQQFVAAGSSAVIDRLVSDGWIANPRLIHMRHEGRNDDKMVQVEDREIWKAKGYYAEPTYIYHPDKGSRVVPADEAKKLLTQGWYASPAHFPSNHSVTTSGKSSGKEAA